MYRNSKKSIVLPLIISISLLVGIWAGSFFSNETVHYVNNKSYSSGKLDRILDLIDYNYVDSVNVSKITERVIPDLLKDLDPHTVYIPAKDLENVNEDLYGKFGGIGVQFIMHQDTVVVAKVINGGPASKVDIQAGDRIVKLNDTIIAGVKKKNTDIMKSMRGELGTSLTIHIKRRGHKKFIKKELLRAIIPIESVDVAYMINSDLAYIKVDKFAYRTYSEFSKALGKLKTKGMKKLIVDLRGNTGGFLGNAINMVNEFLPDKKLIVYTEGKSSPKSEYFSNGSGRYKDIKLVVLIDESSASASEIFAGAIQDNDRGFIIGRRSFGKGLVQQQRDLPDGSALRLTIARYYTPSGRCIQKSYKKGKKDYYSEIFSRFEHGEFTSRDSIHFNDSLKYKTSKGRIVFGGGGIMPDYFVPMDTTKITRYLTRVTDKALIYNFAFTYVDRNRKSFNGKDDYKSILDYSKKQNLFNKFIKFSSSKGVKANSKDIKESREILETKLYSYIGYFLIDNEGMYPIIRPLDTTIDKAIEVLNSDKNL
ncbi:MAG: S41 family peptidase [Marinifilaceae bacterium]|nr:S41 family peptidase [Marinifilaceae bacterium]